RRSKLRRAPAQAPHGGWAMKLLKRIAVLGVLLGFAGMWIAYAQTAADIALVDKIGWWTRRPGAQPVKNPNNFEVAAGVQGDESVAALRVLIRGTVTKATLVLGEADAPFKDLNPGKLRVCTTSSPWLVVDGGPYADAPKPDCSGAVELIRTTDAAKIGTWSGDVTSMLAGARSEVSLMVLTVPDPAAVIPPSYYMKLAARVATEGTLDVKPSPSPVVTPSAPSGNSGAAFPRVTTPSQPTATAATPGAGATATPTAPPTPVAATGSANAIPPRLTISSKAEKKKWGKLVLLVPLAAIGAALYAGGRKFLEQRALDPAST
ncbi:MAG: hypothetical protein QOC92_4415, partial [Acidimicrobiaceae bacterium]